MLHEHYNVGWGWGWSSPEWRHLTRVSNSKLEVCLSYLTGGSTRGGGEQAEPSMVIMFAALALVAEYIAGE